MPQSPQAAAPLSPEVEKAYQERKDTLPQLRQSFASWKQTSCSKWWLSTMEKEMSSLGLKLDIESGRLSYTSAFKPLELPYDICYVRHGKTAGNTEPRVFQGAVDYENNKLNDVGKQQAIDAAKKTDAAVKEQNWLPDAIIFSPISRAKDTGEYFASMYPSIPTYVMPETAEQAFGEWDNQRLIDMPPTSLAHIFYLDQNALIKADAPHTVVGTKDNIPPESFCEAIVRMRAALLKIAGLKPVADNTKRPKVLMYGHSMIGAAASILLGHGRGEGEGILAWDGGYTMPNAAPIFLSPQQPYATCK